jgi:light-regulated signal transduction histidine kinase (bacteriophytochrome)
VAAERALERHAGDLERSNRELEEFASIASHDVSAPLLTVSGFLTLLDERHAGELDPEAREFIAHARGGTRKLQHLIADLLEYSRAGRTGLAPEPVALGAVVRETLGGLSASIEAAGAEVVVDPLPTVRATPASSGACCRTCSRTPSSSPPARAPWCTSRRARRRPAGR